MPGIPGIIIICTEKNIAHDVYNTETNLTPLYAWEKVSNSRGLGKIFLPKLNHPYPTPPEKSNGQPHRGWERSRLCTLVDVIMWWFSRPKFSHFKFENTPMKDTNGKKKFKKMLRFLFVDDSFSLWNCVSRNSTLFSSRRIRELGLFWTNQGSGVSEETWDTFCTLWSRKVRLLKGIFVFIKVSWMFSTFRHWRDRKPENVHLKLIFFPCAQPL